MANFCSYHYMYYSFFIVLEGMCAHVVVYPNVSTPSDMLVVGQSTSMPGSAPQVFNGSPAMANFREPQDQGTSEGNRFYICLQERSFSRSIS